MKIDVKELYKDESWGWYDYQPMLNAFGKVAIQVDDDAYQGDSRLLYDAGVWFIGRSARVV